MESMERLLSLWLEDQRQRNAPLNAAIVQKAKFDDLQREHGESSQAERFPMSKGWLVRFKERHCLPHFKLNSAAPGNKNMYTEMLKSVIIEEEVAEAAVDQLLQSREDLSNEELMQLE
ncbi:hypothetical protein H8959_001224 [Pygathrix nigripes]